ncbi:MAG TPA: DUF952 domain-containing protein [Chloroflexi bacterium]|nr:DUF952 domain-containing protein [Chloroflexota bacterium]HHW86324.1 DUF952 domain-containing protein [Chloroflexota bacterium]
MADVDARVIYHMTPQAVWDAQRSQPVFTPASLAAEGFIHCTAEPEKLQQVANRFYRDIPGPFIIVCIAAARLDAELRWELVDGHTFPHIFGPLNWEAVERILPFPRQADNWFVLPEELKV